MQSNQGGSIVNIGSMWAKQAIKATQSSAYSMAKAGLHSLTQRDPTSQHHRQNQAHPPPEKLTL
jgi:NAD(P)-dependent dehydrogenase (short-subunit alcohol dehydrogenase family)